MKRIRQLALAAAVLGMAGCGPLAQGGITADLVSAVNTVSGRAAPRAAPPPLATPEQMLASPGQFIRVNFRDLGRWDTLVAAGSNTGRVTWVGAANLSVTIEDGIVVATRGLPRDLMGADVGETRAMIRAGGGNTLRQHDFLDNMDQISPRVLQCSIASMGADPFDRDSTTLQATRFEERCTSETLDFTNVYWVNAAGGLVRSLQAISPDAGYLQIDIY